jgi:hypothetical protein
MIESTMTLLAAVFTESNCFTSYDDVFSNKNTAVMCTPYVSESDSDEPTVPVLEKGMPMVVSVVCSSPLSS